jgi:hypothetical protein
LLAPKKTLNRVIEVTSDVSLLLRCGRTASSISAAVHVRGHVVGSWYWTLAYSPSYQHKLVAMADLLGVEDKK